MAKYRSKEFVEAFQFDGDFMNSKGEFYIPAWAITLYKNKVLFFEGPELFLGLYGMSKQHVNCGDYVVQETDGRILHFTKEDFERRFELV